MSFQQGLSGLNASSKNLEIIGNNIANANTYGSKVSRGEFADVYAAALNGSGTNAVGIGTKLAAVAQQFTQGSITTTDNPLDLAISGAGFFQMVDSEGNNPSFTRNGQFKVDSQGYIVNNSQQRLTGIPSDAPSGGTPTALRLPTGALLPPRVTGGVTLELNVDARADIAEQPGLVDPSDLATYSGATSVTLYDLAGTPSPMALYFKKTALDVDSGASTWEVYAALPGGDANAPTLLTSADFDATGTLTSDLAAVDLWAAAPAAFGATPTIDLSGMTAFAAGFAVTDLQQDGYGPGSLASVTVDENGVINARYTNGQLSSAGTVTLANFRNPQGLQPVGDNAWKQSGAEGEVRFGVPGDGSVGVLQSGALEESNIDLTGELVNMITAQRFYQANAQTIKTQDQVLQTLVNLR